jgi:hypothetical protein
VSDKKDVTTRLSDIVGFDPAKKTKLSDELFQEVLEDVSKARIEKAKENAKVQLEKAIKLREDFARAKKDFEKQEKKFNKDLGKLLNKIEAELRGEEPPKDDDKDGES